MVKQQQHAFSRPSWAIYDSPAGSAVPSPSLESDSLYCPPSHTLPSRKKESSDTVVEEALPYRRSTKQNDGFRKDIERKSRSKLQNAMETLRRVLMSSGEVEKGKAEMVLSAASLIQELRTELAEARGTSYIHQLNGQRLAEEVSKLSAENQNWARDPHLLSSTSLEPKDSSTSGTTPPSVFDFDDEVSENNQSLVSEESEAQSSLLNTIAKPPSITILIYPDEWTHSTTNCAHESFQIADLTAFEECLPDGGVTASVHMPHDAINWLEANSDSHVWNVQPLYIGGPLPFMLLPDTSALALFAPWTLQNFNFAHMLANTSQFPVAIKPREEDPTSFLRSGDQQSIDVLTSYSQKLQNQQTSQEVRDSESGGQGSRRSGFSSGTSGSDSGRSSSNNRDIPQRESNGNEGNSPGDRDENGAEGPSKLAVFGINGDSWKQYPKGQNSNTVSLSLQVNTGTGMQPIPVTLAYEYRFATRTPNSDATSCPIVGVRNNQHVAVEIEPLTVFTQARKIKIDRSYSCLTMISDANKGGILPLTFVDRGYGTPGRIGTSSLANTFQATGEGSFGIQNPLNLKGTFGYSETSSTGYTEEKASPEWVVESDAALILFDVLNQGKSCSSLNIVYDHSEAYKQSGNNKSFYGKLNVAYGASAQVQTEGEMLPPISFVMRTQINLWVPSGNPRIPAHGITIVQSTFVADIQNDKPLIHFQGTPFEINLVPPPESNREYAQSLVNPGGTAISLSTAIRNTAARSGKLKKQSLEHLERLQLYEHLSVGWDIIGHQWKDPIWPNLDKNLRAAEASQSTAFFRLGFWTPQEKVEDSGASGSSLVPSKRKTSRRPENTREKKGKSREHNDAAPNTETSHPMDLDMQFHSP